MGRKVTAAVCALMAALLCLCSAQAELPLAYPADTVLSAAPLTKAQRRLAEYLYSPIMNGEERIELPEGTRYDDVGPAMHSLMLDYPEMFHLHRSYTVSYYQNKPDVATAVNVQYRMSGEAAQVTRAAMYEAAMNILAYADTPEAIHDALAARVTYGGTTEMRHTAAAALLTGQATCEGYAQALSLLYRLAGIPCGVISGTAVRSDGLQESHAWNIAAIGGFTLIDATWNDQDSTGFCTEWYFGLSTEQMAADHTPDADLAIPPCGVQANWHVRSGNQAESLTDVLEAVARMVRDGTPVNLRVTDAELYRRIVTDPGSILEEYNAWCAPGEEFYGGYTWMNSDAQQCVIISRVQE